MVAVEGVPQAVLDHGVDKLEIAHLLTGAQVGGVRRLAHALLTAGDHDPAVALSDRLIAQRHAQRSEPHSWLMPQAGTSTGIPALTAAWRAGFWPRPAVRIRPITTLDTSPWSNTTAFERAADLRLAEIMRRHARGNRVEAAGIGVRAALAMTISDMPSP